MLEENQQLEDQVGAEGAAEADLPQDQPAQPDPIEALALEKGWSRKEDWRGREEDWRPADEFIRHGLDRGRDASREMRQMRQSVERTERTLTTLHEREVARIKDEAEARFKAATESGDLRAAAEATRDFENAGKVVQPSGPAPEAQDFAQRNSWFGTHEDATLFAQSIAEKAARAGKSAADQIADAERETKKRFPELFSDGAAPAAKPPASVTPPASRSTGSGARAKGFNDLPVSAQETGRRMAPKIGCTLEEYANTWFSENQA